MANRRVMVCGILTICAAALPALAGAQPGSSRNQPAAPTDLQASAAPSGQVTLSWTDNATNEVGYRIIRERRVSESAWNEPTGFTVGANTTSFQETPPPGLYRYRLRAYNTKGNSSYTPRVEVTVSQASLTPAMPRNLAVVDAGGGKARLTWNDMSNNETGFDIERQPTFWSPMRVSANTTVFEDPTVGGSFAYRIRAVNSSGTSSFTPWVEGKVVGATLGGTTSGNTNPAPAFQAIIPGTGFAGQTPQPGPVGAPGSPGYDAKAIARWDVVPFQTFTSDFNVGVVAFHINGIDRVDFSCNGGPWTTVREMQLNPRTGVWEYTARLRAADFATDGAVEVRAVAWPVVGEPRVLAGPQANERTSGEASMVLFANAHGTILPAQVYVSTAGSDGNSGLSPQAAKRTLNGANGAIRVAADHQWGGTVNILDGDVWEIENAGANINNTHFVTIRGLGKTATTLRPVGASQNPWSNRGFLWPALRRVRYQDLAIDISYFKQITSANNDATVWIDNCRVYSSLGWGDPSPMTYFSYAIYGCSYFATDSVIEDCANGFTDHVLVRGCHSHKISGDVFQNSRAVINCTVDLLSQDVPTEQHTDLFQQFRPGSVVDNIIAYNVSCTRLYGVQNFYSDTADAFRNIAYVNVAIQNLPVPQPYAYMTSESNVASQWESSYNHVLFLNVSCPGRRILFHTGLPSWSASNFLFMNCVLEELQDGQGQGGLPAGMRAVNCYTRNLYQGVPWGANTMVRANVGDVALTFTSTTPAGTFTHTGAAAPYLQETGAIMPGFPLSKSRGAFQMPRWQP